MDGIKISEIGVPPVEVCNQNFIQVFLAEKDSQQTGVAIVNPTYDTLAVTLNMSAGGDPDFNVFGYDGISKGLVLPPKGHVSLFVSELFPEYVRNSIWQKKTFTGLLRVTASQPVPVLALKTSNVPEVGFMMSTLPAACR